MNNKHMHNVKIEILLSVCRWDSYFLSSIVSAVWFDNVSIKSTPLTWIVPVIKTEECEEFESLKQVFVCVCVCVCVCV